MTNPQWRKFCSLLDTHNFKEADVLLSEQPDLISLANDIGETVLHYLAVENNLEAVEWLHKNGADINTRNTFGIPVIFEVAQLEYKELFEWFVQKGADLNLKTPNGTGIIDSGLSS